MMNPINIVNPKDKRKLFTYYFENGYAEDGLERFIEENYQIPISKQVLFWKGKHLKNSMEIYSKYWDGSISRDEIVYVDFAIRIDVQTECDLVENASSLNLNTINNAVVLHPNNEEIVGNFSMDLSIEKLKKDIASTLNFDDWKIIELSYQSCLLKSTDNLYNLLFEGKHFSNELHVNMLISPTKNTKIQEVCKEKNIPLLRRINVKLLTEIITIDAGITEIRNISELMEVIQTEKMIPKHMQKILFDNMELKEEIQLMEFLLENDLVMNDEISVLLIVSTPEVVTVDLDASFNIQENKIQIAETATILQLKEVVSGLISVPESHFDLVNLHDIQRIKPLLNDQQIWQVKQNGTYKIVVIKKIKIVIQKINEDPLNFFFPITNWESETIDSMRLALTENRFPNQPMKLIFKEEDYDGVFATTLLKDLNVQTIFFHSENNSNCVKCSLM
uniref:Ubiquitin-like domain-containing protein n=1 Tax=Clytia hemisphaerica TaxID=252671 RepID=A0A7M5V046_9CNID